MRKSRSSGSVGERGGNDPLYPDIPAHLSYRPVQSQMPVLHASQGHKEVES